MCAQLCSLMKAQLLKTYEEVVFRFGGHFDMSLMQDCQVSAVRMSGCQVRLGLGQACVYWDLSFVSFVFAIIVKLSLLCY